MIQYFYIVNIFDAIFYLIIYDKLIQKFEHQLQRNGKIVLQQFTI